MLLPLPLLPPLPLPLPLPVMEVPFCAVRTAVAPPVQQLPAAAMSQPLLLERLDAPAALLLPRPPPSELLLELRLQLVVPLLFPPSMAQLLPLRALPALLLRSATPSAPTPAPAPASSPTLGALLPVLLLLLLLPPPGHAGCSGCRGGAEGGCSREWCVGCQLPSSMGSYRRPLSTRL